MGETGPMSCAGLLHAGTQAALDQASSCEYANPARMLHHGVHAPPPPSYATLGELTGAFSPLRLPQEFNLTANTT